MRDARARLIVKRRIHMHSDSLSDLVDWFTAHDGTFDRSALTFAQIEGLGWGAFALRDLQVQPLAIIAIFFFFNLSLLVCWKHGGLNPLYCDYCSKAIRCSQYLAISPSRPAPPPCPL